MRRARIAFPRRAMARAGSGARILALALSALAPGCSAPPSPPSGDGLRIVSINPCIDAILLRVADPASVAAISHYSHDPRATSVPLDLARRFPATSGTAEEIVALRPDLVLSGSHVSPSTVAALRRMGIRLVQYPVPDSVEESVRQVRDIALQSGHAERGEQMARAIEAAAAPSQAAPVPALIWGGSGLVPGSGTLADDMLKRAGYRNMSATYGLSQWDVLGLERLLADPPSILFSIGAADMGRERMADHRAVARLERRIDVIPYPSRLLSCGGPAIIEAMELMKTTRAKAAT